MASATFTGNVFNDLNTNINCYFQAYHVQQNAWSDVRTTEYNQYSIDLADSDWLTNSNGASNNGENVLICLWIDDQNPPNNPSGTSRSGIKELMSIHRVDLNGSNVYNFDVQLIPKQQPTCTWSIPSTATINNVINSTHNSTDVYDWQFGGRTFYHDDVYFGEPMFDSVGISLHEYDWENGYTTDDFYTYSVIGDYSPVHKTTNQYQLSSECTELIRLKYNQPTGYFTYSDNNPILGDDVLITHNITDPDSRITNVKYFLNNQLVDENTLLDYAYNHIVDEIWSYDLRMEIYWNDGWEDQMHSFTDTLTLDNVIPTVDISINTDINDVNTKIFVSNAFDFEDRMSHVEFEVFVAPEYIFEETPTDITWSSLDSKTITDAPYDATIKFYKGGQFKMTAVAYDLDGGVSILDEIEFSVQIGGTGDSGTVSVFAGNQFYDWE